MIECRSKYYRTKLRNSQDRNVYDLILDGMRKLEKEIWLEEAMQYNYRTPLSTIYNYVLLDNPGLFYVDTGNIAICTAPGWKLSVQYRYTPEEALRIERKLKAAIDNVTAAAIKCGLTEEQTLQYLHDFLAANVRYEHADKTYHKAHSILGPLMHGRSVCEGYAKAFKILCDASGISCIVLYGITNEERDLDKANHAWNVVKMNGKCFHIDVTWDRSESAHDHVAYRYYKLSDAEMAVDHYWDTTLLPACL